MKKRIHPDLFRNSLFSNYLETNNIFTNNNIKSLIAFQNFEIKNNLKKFFKEFHLNLLNLSIIRNINVLNIHLFYYHTKLIYKNIYIRKPKKVFIESVIAKFNFLKNVDINLKNKVVKKSQDFGKNLLAKFNIFDRLVNALGFFIKQKLNIRQYHPYFDKYIKKKKKKVKYKWRSVKGTVVFMGRRYYSKKNTKYIIIPEPINKNKKNINNVSSKNIEKFNNNFIKNNKNFYNKPTVMALTTFDKKKNSTTTTIIEDEIGYTNITVEKKKKLTITTAIFKKKNIIKRFFSSSFKMPKYHIKNYLLRSVKLKGKTRKRKVFVVKANKSKNSFKLLRYINIRVYGTKYKLILKRKKGIKGTKYLDFVRMKVRGKILNVRLKYIVAYKLMCKILEIGEISNVNNLKIINFVKKYNNKFIYVPKIKCFKFKTENDKFKTKYKLKKVKKQLHVELLFQKILSFNFKQPFIDSYEIFKNKLQIFNLPKLSNKFNKKRLKNLIYKLNLNNTKNKNESISLYNKTLNSKIIQKSLKFYYIKSSKLFIQKKLLTALHLYTGYLTINLFGKCINLTLNLKKERLYNMLFKYTRFFTDQILKKKYYANCFDLKYFPRNLKTHDMIVHNLKFKITLVKFLRNIPFYMVKIFKKFLTHLFFKLSLKNQNPENLFYILRNSFKGIYKIYKSHFRKAFKFYKIIIKNLLRYNLLPVYGLKLIIKGRFGKTRKQIENITYGSLRLNTIIQRITYYSSIMLTKRGSYGFHMWFALKKNKVLGA